MIKFRDLSGWLKFAAIVAWIDGFYIIGMFLVGFYYGLTGAW